MGYDFHNSLVVKATRKEHECEQCGRKIAVGSTTYKGKGLFDGYFYSNHQHIECHAAGIAYAEMTGLWGEEYMWFQHDLEDQSDKDWLLEHHPIVAERLRLEPLEEEEKS